MADVSLTGGCWPGIDGDKKDIYRNSQSVTSKMTDVSVLFVCLGNICM